MDAPFFFMNAGENKNILSWETRLQIVMDAAQG